MDLLHRWVRNYEDVLATGDKYANTIVNFNSAQNMNKFPKLTDPEIDAIIGYANADKAAKDKEVATGGAAGGANNHSESDNSLLYGVLTLVLGIIALTLLYINSNLRKISEEKEGIASAEPIPFYRNKTYILGLALITFVLGGYWVAKGATALGRAKDYQPEQPIFYSHKVHAGLNQINCLYCHGAAQDSRHAMIPSVNVCMNCHMSIQEYTGPQLYDGNGNEVSGTNEIKKLYEYAGYTAKPGAVWTPNANTKPIAWVKIHNLPDHVYFNHSQHIKVGGVACQTCHGEITKMDEVKQFANLSMGWCVNCHRNTGVDFYKAGDSAHAESGNKFYKAYSKFHDEIEKGRSGEGKTITVDKIGGIECQKCHY